jgi:hypothetical protein
MRKCRPIAVLLAGALLAAPAAACAKGGTVMFDRYPDVQAIGSPMAFSVFLRIARVAGARPLVTFRNTKTGEVVRVRARSPRMPAAVSRGVVRLPSRGPWETEVSVRGRRLGGGDAPFRVGVGLFEIVPATRPAAGRPGVDPAGRIPPALIALAGVMLALGVIGLGTAVVIRREAAHSARPRG